MICIGDLQGFNREMEDIYRVQKAFAIPDAELRDTLREDNKQFIMPYYRTFLQRYRTVPFSRNPDKYIKYSEQEIGRFMDGFFDAASWTAVITVMLMLLTLIWPPYW